MPHPFRFGVQFAKLPANRWAERVRRVEALGYSSAFWPDHFGDQWDPMTATAAAAAITTSLRVGALVYDVDYRHPVIYAKSAATLHLISGGRCEFGIGAGWMQTDYVEAGIPYDRPGVRIARLSEALEIITSMWTQDKTSFEGEHYSIREIARAGELPAGERPKILIGGGGPKILGVAGRHADIVSINPALPEGRVTRSTAADCVASRVRQKIDWVRAGAEASGRSLDQIEFNSLCFMVQITDDPGPIRQMLAGNTGMTPDEVAECSLFLTGSAAEICDRLEKRREETGISYIVIQGQDERLLERFAKDIVEPLNGR